MKEGVGTFHCSRLFGQRVSLRVPSTLCLRGLWVGKLSGCRSVASPASGVQPLQMFSTEGNVGFM